MSALEERIAFCTWSTRPDSVDELISIADQIGIRKVQLAIDPLIRDPRKWADCKDRLQLAGIKPVSGMFESVGEDYSTIQSIHKTGGVVPDETWPKTWANIEKMMPICEDLGIHLTTLHAGFLPEDQNDAVFAKVVERLRKICDLGKKHGVDLSLETGQESAKTLKAALEAIDRGNLGINFDPANMILYGSGDPIEALQLLIPHVLQVHIKDATPSDQPGQSWGTEVVTGTGNVDWPAFFAVLNDEDFAGNMAIEREAGDQRVADIKTAKAFLQRTLG